MKLAVITLPLHTNYGGILQAFALQKVLKEMGHQVTLLENKQFTLGLNIPLRRVAERMKKRWLQHEDCYILYERKMKKVAPVVQQHTNRFVNTHINRVRLWSLTSVKEHDYDGFVVGSDQIWRPLFYPHISRAFLDFTKGWKVHRVAYAPSFGTDVMEYSPSQIKECQEGISRFDGISVREVSGVDLCYRYFNIKAEHVLDPTMLLTADDYNQLIANAHVPESNGDLFCYVLDETKEIAATIQSVTTRYGMTPFYINAFTGNRKVPLEQRIQPPVESWIRAFADARLVITDSFHACVFSILYHKPFIVIPNKGRGQSRMLSLLQMFGLQHLMKSEESTLTSSLPTIDWNDVDQRLFAWQQKSRSFLVKHLASL